MPRIVNFADIIQIVTMLVRATFKGSKKVEIIRNYVLKCNISYIYI